MPIHPLIAARQVCELRDWSASNLEINKVLYLAHMITLGRTNGVSGLVTEHFQAWDYGPVLPSVYHRAKAFGSGAVQNIFRGLPEAPDGVEKSAIAEVVKSVEGMTPGHLVAITHWPEGAWAKHYQPHERGITIPNSDILEEYRRRVA